MKCLSVEAVSGEQIKHGDVVYACAVSGANVVRDMREVVTNVIGGKMKRYEAVLDDTIGRAIENLKAKATEAGYDGLIGVSVSHPHITDGAIEVVVVGTGFWYDR